MADSKELYGIKFKDSVEGEVFYTKLIKAVGEHFNTTSV